MRSFCLLLETRVCLCVLDYFSCYQICIFLCMLLCSTSALLTPASFPSSSPLPCYPFFPTFKYSSISCQLAQVPHCWQRDILPSHQRTTPPPPQHWKADLRRRHLWSPARHRGTCSLVLLSSCFPLLLTPRWWRRFCVFFIRITCSSFFILPVLNFRGRQFSM